MRFNKYFWPLLESFGSWEEVWQSAHIPSGLYIPQDWWAEFQVKKKLLDPHRVLEEYRTKGISVVLRNDPLFPACLLQVMNIPCILYCCGDISLLNQKSLAIVGARKATAYGLQQARTIARRIAQEGLVIVSGLARGIDAAAHEGALAADGATVAVLGSGLNKPYPRETLHLFKRICEDGLVISEYPPDTAPLRTNFPIRNRIISGLSLGVCVVEAQAKSGSLITCDLALEQGKDVFAVPGPVTSPNSIGPLRLIQSGAKLVIYPEDILEELGIEVKDSLFHNLEDKTKRISEKEKQVLNALSWEPLHMDKLLLKGVEFRKGLYETLLGLECHGLIKQLPGKYYVRV